MSVLYEVANHVATVTIDRPEVLNAVDLPTEAELVRIWDDIERRDDVRVVVLTGAGERSFCAGADLKNTSNLKGVEYWAASRPGGFEMVLGCDLVVACEEASFGLPEPLVGRLPLDGGMLLLQRQIPFRQAMGMMLTGQRIKAQRAYEIGLINEVVPRAELDTAVNRWVQQLLACAPLSLKAVKQVVRLTGTLSPAQAHGMRLPALVTALQSEDSNEGVLAFQQKRKPQWRGR